MARYKQALQRMANGFVPAMLPGQQEVRGRGRPPAKEAITRAEFVEHCLAREKLERSTMLLEVIDQLPTEEIAGISVGAKRKDDAVKLGKELSAKLGDGGAVQVYPREAGKIVGGRGRRKTPA